MAVDNNPAIEMWMAELKANATRVKRNLFGPQTEEDRRATRVHLQEASRMADMNSKSRWNFDFGQELPTKGRFQWETMQPHQVPSAYRASYTCRVLPIACSLRFPQVEERDTNCDTSATTAVEELTPSSLSDSGVFVDTDAGCLSDDESAEDKTTTTQCHIEQAKSAPSSSSSSSVPVHATSAKRKRSTPTITDYFKVKRRRSSLSSSSPSVKRLQ